MRRLWSDISVHRASAAVFAVWWFAVHLYMFATGSDGIPVHVVWLHIFTAIAAGALVAWWMYPVREGLLSGWRPAEAPLAGSLVAVAVVTVVFARDGLKAVLAGTGDMTGLVELLFSWLVASVIIGAIGLLCGLMGAGLGSVLAKYLKQLA